MTTRPDAVTSHGLTKAFGSFVAVDDVTFAVRQGEIFGFLGPNGAGKTTTIKMLAGLVEPTSGSGTVAGHDVRTEQPAIKRRIGYMSQLFSLYGDLTVDENITFFSRLSGVPRGRREARRDWVLRMAGLTERRRLRTGELPLGWKQRLALGCAILHEPPVLFLDEPTSGVDPISRRAFWDLIYELATAGTTVFVTTHYMEEAEYCHRLALMNRGRLIALDTPGGIRSRMTDPLLRVETADAAAAVAALRDTPGVLDAAMFGRDVHVTVRGTDRAAEAITSRLQSRGVPVSRVTPVAPSLEDVFVSLVRAGGGAVAG